MTACYDDQQINEWATRIAQAGVDEGTAITGETRAAEPASRARPRRGQNHRAAADAISVRRIHEHSRGGVGDGIDQVRRAAPGGESESRKDLVRFGLELPVPRCVSTDLRAKPTEVGTATHLVLQYLDFTKATDAGQIEQQIEAMLHRKLILPGDAKIVDREAILWLAQCELGQLLAKHHRDVRREFPVYFATPAPQATTASTDPMDRLMIRGRLDVLIPLSDGLIVADYKTDRVTADTIDARVEFYKPQMTSYADAMSRIAKLPVTKIYLAFTSPKILRTIDLG